MTRPSPKKRDAGEFVRSYFRKAAGEVVAFLNENPSTINTLPRDDEHWRAKAAKEGFGAGEVVRRDGWVFVEGTSFRSVADGSFSISAGPPETHTEQVASKDVCDAISRDMEELIEHTARDLELAVGAFVDDKRLHTAVLCRSEVLDAWPWTTQTEAGRLLDVLTLGRLPPARSPSVPKQAALGVWGDWMAKGCKRLGNTDLAERIKAQTELDLAEGRAVFHSFVTEHPDTRRPWWLRGAAMASIMVAEKRIRDDARRPAIAIDAGHAHQSMLGHVRDLSAEYAAFMDPQGDSERIAPVGNSYLMMKAPDGRIEPLQLRLDIGDHNDGLGALIVHALQRMTQTGSQASMLRHYATLQRLFSIEGGRTGEFRWTLDAHMQAMGYGERVTHDRERRKQVALAVSALTRFELVAKERNGEKAWIAPLFSFDLKAVTDWKDPDSLEGARLRVNPLIYRGVRKESGRLGANFGWAPSTLPEIDHVRYPYAHALGLILPIRFRLRWNEGHDSVHLKGASLLSMAGIAYTKRRASVCWSALENNLAQLQKHNALGAISWKGEPWTLDGVAILEVPDWVRDRTLHGVRPVEQRALTRILTGGELRAWRKDSELSRSEAALRLGVSLSTIQRAERAPEKRLTKGLAAAFLPYLNESALDAAE